MLINTFTSSLDVIVRDELYTAWLPVGAVNNIQVCIYIYMYLYIYLYICDVYIYYIFIHNHIYYIYI